MIIPKCKTCGLGGKERDFYDSINTYCKDHWKDRVKANREINSDYYKNYERGKAHLPHRILSRGFKNNGVIGLYCVIPKNHPCVGDYSTKMAYYYRNRNRCLDTGEEYRKRYPNKRNAHNKTTSAIKSGKLVKQPCVVCKATKNIHAHHGDYNKPLIVDWLCASCHSLWHRDNGEALNP